MARFRNARRAVIEAEESLAETAGAVAETAPRPSPNPMTNLVLADIALRGGGQLLRHAVERGLLGKAVGPAKAKNLIKGRSMGQTLIGTAIARIATRSVPGALIGAAACWPRRYTTASTRRIRPRPAPQRSSGRRNAESRKSGGGAPRQALPA